MCVCLCGCISLIHKRNVTKLSCSSFSPQPNNNNSRMYENTQLNKETSLPRIVSLFYF